MSALEQGPSGGGPRTPQTDLPVALIVVALLTVAISIPFGPKAIGFGLVAFAAILFVAAGERVSELATWPNAVGLLLLVVWLIPIKGYALPVDLPFQLEHYRVTILLLLFALVAGVLSKRMRFGFAGRGRVVAVLAGVALTTQVMNLGDIDANTGVSGTAIKSLSYFLAYLIVYMLVCSTLASRLEIDRVIRVLVAGAGVVAVAALYEARTGYNPFNHLAEWLPGIERQYRDIVEVRGGRLRVLASSQHPIALGVALTLAVPMAFYLSGRAATVVKARLWVVVACLLAVGAAATISRTTVAMAVVMAVAALSLRGREVARYWPVLLLVPFVIHFAAPGALGGLYKQFFPKRGLIADLNGRAGQGGSGRLADIDPAMRLWERSPLLGHGLGNEFPTTEDAGFYPGKAPPPIIFDDQYLDSLVKTGVLGLGAILVFFWGGAIGLIRRARRLVGAESDLAAACGIAAAGFSAAMLFFDAFAFVQATLVCVMIIALGYRGVELLEQSEGSTGESIRGGVS
ncbi:MAG: O-antigen ligase family protein [Gaiellales bacterium]